MNEIRKILVVGLGLMGTPIATLLMKAGYKVRGFDIIKKQVSDLVRFGLKPAKSPKRCDKRRRSDYFVSSYLGCRDGGRGGGGRNFENGAEGPDCDGRKHLSALGK